MDAVKNMVGGGSSDLDDTIGALQGGLTSISPTAAVSNIDGWQQKLSGLGLTDVASDLGELKGLLTSGNLDGKKIGAVLTRLGEKTSASASQAPAADMPKLQQLGSMLSGAGKTLG
ncbi:MAG: hypothetical protein H7Z42_02345 [Roseiflexaceae bacterium]|nr:hypothetical protein [Roseiflexaceae bacterium]